MLSFLVTILVAAIGGFIGRKLKLPAGTIIGAMIAVLLMNIFFDHANVPNPVRPYIRIMAGIYIGTRMSMQDVLNLRNDTARHIDDGFRIDLPKFLCRPGH